MSSPLGVALVDVYYKYSPDLAELLRASAPLRFVVRRLIDALVLFIQYPALVVTSVLTGAMVVYLAKKVFV